MEQFNTLEYLEKVIRTKLNPNLNWSTQYGVVRRTIDFFVEISHSNQNSNTTNTKFCHWCECRITSLKQIKQQTHKRQPNKQTNKPTATTLKSLESNLDIAWRRGEQLTTIKTYLDSRHKTFIRETAHTKCWEKKKEKQSEKTTSESERATAPTRPIAAAAQL